MSLTLTAAQVRLLRVLSQRLHPAEGMERPSEPVAALNAMFGAQAQELPAALLSVRARSHTLTAARLEQARNTERSILWTWLMRGTLHLVSAEDARWLLPLLAPGLIEAGRRRMEQLGWDEERTARGLRLLEASLRQRGPLTRADISALLAEGGLPHEGQAPVHLLYRAAVTGLLCGGPDLDAGKEHSYMLLEDWLGGLAPLPREEALARMALRYLEAFGPAAPRDLAAWSGLPLADARRGWQGIQERLEEVQVSGAEEREPLWLPHSRLGMLEQARNHREQPPMVRLLPRFDTLWMAYSSRDLLIEPAFAKRVNAGGGMVHPMLLVNGQVRGVWKMEQKKGALELRVQPFTALESKTRPGLEAETANIARFLGLEAHITVENPPGA